MADPIIVVSSQLTVRELLSILINPSLSTSFTEKVPGQRTVVLVILNSSAGTTQLRVVERLTWTLSLIFTTVKFWTVPERLEKLKEIL